MRCATIYFLRIENSVDILTELQCVICLECTLQISVNGDVICTVLPSNKSCAWVTRAKFKPNLVPEEIMDTNLTVS